MAEKYTIPTNEGVIEVPAWATQSTLESLSNQSSNSVRLTSKLLSTVKKNEKIDDEIIDAVKANTQVGVNNAKTNNQEAQHRSSMLLKGATAVRDTAGFFGDSEKPLTSMVKATESVVSKLKGSNGKLDASSKALIAGDDAMGSIWKKIGGVAVDIGFAWAGWNAAKFEQFAEVQKSMIDSGAIVFDTSDAFNELYTDAFRSGITYKTFADVVANFGGTMVGLGGDTSRGSQSMMRLFKRLEVNSNELGDLGFSNKELLNTYAQYIETQRLTGSLDRKLAGSGELLESSFQNLVVESTAIANLTAMNRSDILQKQMAALSDTSLAAGISDLEDQGLEDTAATVGNLAKQFALFDDIGPSDLMSTLHTALNRATQQFSGNMENFNITQVIAAMDSEAVGAIGVAMPGLLDAINEQVINAEKNNGELSETFLLDILKTANMEKLAGSSAVGTALGKVQDLQGSLYLIMENLGGLVGKDLEEEAKKMKNKMSESGESVVAVNEMSKAFLTAQEFITLPMQSFGEKMEFTTGLLGDGASWLNDLFNDYTGKGHIKTKVSDAGETIKETVKDYMGGDSSISESTITPSSLKSLTMPQLRDRLTENRRNAKINKELPLNEGNTKQMQQIAKEEALILRQIKVLENDIIAKENILMDKEYKKAAGIVNG
tara:strand:- start:760 stop:2745 length:1986 start_codon:yes stop_codon:yes gene_type:complete